jgi:hypothetical protein
VSKKTLSTRLVIFCLVPIPAGVSKDSPAAPEDNQQSSPLQVVIVLEVNPNQGKVFCFGISFRNWNP